MKDFSIFEKNNNINFNDKNLLKKAFTHRSYINENSRARLQHNERLEYLGDAVLELVVTEYLYKNFEDKTEGELTAYRAALVNTVTISNVARALGMNDFLLLSKGEARDTGKARMFILANTFEAVIGAIYLDQGYKVSELFITKNIITKLPNILRDKLWQDAKSNFQERAQEIVGITPKYEVLEETGPDHEKKFKVGVYLNNECIAKGGGQSKQEAEQSAAREGLKVKKWT